MFLSPIDLMFGLKPLSPNIIGRLGPLISASSSPTFEPKCANPSAKLAATVDFPTPPFPEAMAIIFLTPGNFSIFSLFEFLTCASNLISISRFLSTFSWIAKVHSSLNLDFSGHAGVVRKIVKLTLFPSVCKSLIMFKETRSFFRSGSITLLNAASIFSFMIIVYIRKTLQQKSGKIK